MRIHTIDLEHQDVPHSIAVYLVEAPQGPILVESGPTTTLDTLKRKLAVHGVSPGDVQHVLVTHIHLDHAGAAGWWARQGARVHVHHLGAPHLVDPSKLVASATRIYGDDMDRLWGEVTPLDPNQLEPLKGDQEVNICGVKVRTIDSPGHAKHHIVFCMEDVAFTGDAAGVRLEGGDFIQAPAPPPEFHREAWHTTIDTLARQDLSVIYPTHFGPVRDVPAHFERLHQVLDDVTEFVARHRNSGAARDAIVAAHAEWNRERALASGLSDTELVQYEVANPLFMTVDGILRYLTKREREENAS